MATRKPDYTMLFQQQQGDHTTRLYHCPAHGFGLTVDDVHKDGSGISFQIEPTADEVCKYLETLGITDDETLLDAWLAVASHFGIAAAGQ